MKDKFTLNTTNTCPLCHSSQIDKIFEKETIPYFKCTSCNFIFSKPLRNANFENKLEDFETSSIQYFQMNFREDFIALYQWVRKFRTLENARLLDIGCGSGKWVRNLRDESVEAYGLEPSTALYNHFLCHDEFFFNQTVEEYRHNFPQSKFDIITILDVIEHVDEPLILLENVDLLLKEGGLLFISTPDVGSVIARFLGKKWHFYHKYHLAYFSQKTLDAVVKPLRFNAIDFSHKGHRRPLSYIAQYFFEYVLGKPAIKFPYFLDKIVIPINIFATKNR